MNFWCNEEKEQFLPLFFYPTEEEEEVMVFIKADTNAIMNFFLHWTNMCLEGSLPILCVPLLCPVSSAYNESLEQKKRNWQDYLFTGINISFTCIVHSTLNSWKQNLRQIMESSHRAWLCRLIQGSLPPTLKLMPNISVVQWAVLQSFIFL